MSLRHPASYLAVIALLVALGLAPRQASAADAGLDPILLGALIPVGLLLTAGVVTTSYNAYCFSQDDPDAWPTAGYLFGALNVSAGGLIFLLDAGDTGRLVAVASSQIALGAASITFAALAPQSTFTLLPYVGPDEHGGVQAGVSLTLLDF